MTEETLKTVIAVTFVLSGYLAREIGQREATEFEIVCGLGICRDAVNKVLENPEHHELIVSQALNRLRGIVGMEDDGELH